MNKGLFGLGMLLVMLASGTENVCLIAVLGIAGNTCLFFSLREFRNPFRLRRMVREFKGYLCG